MRRALRIVAVTTLLVVVFGVGRLLASEPDANANALRAGLTSFASTFGALAEFDELAEAVPLTGFDPAGAAGLHLDQLLNQVLAPLPASFTSLEALQDALEGRDTTLFADVAVTVGCSAAPVEAACPAAGEQPVQLTHVGGTVTASIPIKAVRVVTVSTVLPTNQATFTGGALSVRAELATTLVFDLDTARIAADPNDTTAMALADATTATLSANLVPTPPATAVGVQFSSSFGFTDVTVALDDVDVSVGLAATFSDPDSDGRITRDEWANHSIVDLVGLSRTGNASGDVALTSGLLPSPVTASFDVDLGAADFGGVTFSNVAFDPLAAFSRIDAESVIAALGQLGGAIAGSQHAEDLALPFVKGTLGEAANAAKPIVDFVQQQTLVCGTHDTTPPTGDVALSEEGTLVYCQGFVIETESIGVVDQATVQWQRPAGAPWVFESDPGSNTIAAPGTVGSEPSAHVVLQMTALGTPFPTATYDVTIGPAGNQTTESRLNQRPPTTVQQLAGRLAELGGFDDAAALGEPMVAYDDTTRALSVRMRKTFSTPSARLAFDVADQLEADTGIFGMASLGIAGQTAISVSASDLTVDLTFGVLLTDDPEDIEGGASPIPDLPDDPNPQPDDEPSDLDRFFVRFDAGRDELRIGDASLAVTSPPTLTGRLGYLELSARPRDFVIGKRAGDASPVFALQLETADPLTWEVGGTERTLANAVQLRKLLFNLPDYVQSPSINLAMSGGLDVWAQVGDVRLPPGADSTVGIGIAWPDVTSGLPAITPETDFDELFSGFNLAPNLYGNHDGATSPHTLADTTNAPFTDDMVGKRVENVTDGSHCIIGSVAADGSSATCEQDTDDDGEPIEDSGGNPVYTTLAGGERNEWRNGDRYKVEVGDPLALLWLLLDYIDDIVAGLDTLSDGAVGAVFDADLPLVDVSPREVVHQISDLRRATSELRGTPGPRIQCGTQRIFDADGNLQDVADPETTVPPVGDPSVVETAPNNHVYCSVAGAKPPLEDADGAPTVAWEITGGTGAEAATGTVVAGGTAAGTVAVLDDATGAIAPAQNATFAVTGSRQLASAENPQGYRIRVVYTDMDGEHVLDFPEVDVPSTLQQFEDAVERKLGLPPEALTLDLTPGSVPRLQVTLSYTRCTPGLCGSDEDPTDETLSVPLAMDLDLSTVASLPDFMGFVGVDADVPIAFDYHADATLDFALDLDASSGPALMVLEDTGIELEAKVASTGVQLGASIGPLNLKAGAHAKPVPPADPEEEPAVARGVVQVGARVALSGPAGDSSLGAFVGGLNAEFSAVSQSSCPDTTALACAALTLSSGVGAGETALGELLASVTYDPVTGEFDYDFTIPDDLIDKILDSILSWDMLLRALPPLIGYVEDGLSAGASGTAKIPLVGDALDGGAQVARTLRVDIVEPLVDAFDAFVDPANAAQLRDGLRQEIYDVLVPDPGDPASGFLLAYDGSKPAGEQYQHTADPEEIRIRIMCGAVECDFETPAHDLSDVDDVRVTFTVGQHVDLNVPFDVGVDGVPLRLQGGVRTSADWNVLVDFGLSRAVGPYLVVDKESASDPHRDDRSKEITVAAVVGIGDNAAACDDGAANRTPITRAIDASTFDASETRCLAGTLGFVQVNVADGDASGPQADAEKDTPTALKLDTFLDLLHSDGSHQLGLSDLLGGKLDVNLGLGVDARVNLRFRTSVPQLQGAGFPSVIGTFHAGWGPYTWELQGAPAQPKPYVRFDNLYLDVSAWVGDYLQPILDEVRNITGPFMPFIDTLNTPIPVVSHIAKMIGQPPITLISLMEALSGNDLSLIKSIASFLQFANSEASSLLVAGFIPLGGGLGGAFALKDEFLDTAPTPADAQKAIDKADALYKEGKQLLKQQLQGPDNAGDANKIQQAFNKSATWDKAPPGAFGVPGLTFPFMDDAGQVFGLLLGQDITLVRYDFGTLSATAGFSYNFGPFFVGPVPLTAKIGGSVTIKGRFVVGYDTSGLRKVLDGGSGVHLFDGIFIDDLDINGVDVPEITFIGEVYAGAGVTVFIATAGIEGGIRLTVDLNLDDRPEPDGKLRIEEIFNKLSNPVCLFDVSGRLEAFLRAFLEINYFIGSKRWDWEIFKVTLLEFSAACSPPRPVLARVEGNRLIVHVGPDIAKRRVATDTHDEKVVIRPLDKLGKSYSVEMFGIYQVFGPVKGQAQINEVYLDGGPGKDTFLLEPGGDQEAVPAEVFSFTAKAIVYGGSAGPNTIKTGDGDDVIVASNAGDTIDSGAGNDIVVGGSGNDNIEGGPGDDVILGRGGNDNLRGGPGADYVDGGEGDDFLNGGPGTGPTAADASTRDLGDILIGGAGDDQIEGGWGADLIYGDESLGIHGSADFAVPASITSRINSGDWNSPPLSTHAAGAKPVLPGGASLRTATAACAEPGANTGGNDILDGGPDDDILIGGFGNDTVVGGPGDDHLCGNAGDDTLDGDNPRFEDRMTIAQVGTAGDDYLDGGSGHDVLYGRFGNDVLRGGTGNDLLSGGPGNDDLVGGDGRDVLDGGPGADIILGDEGTIAASVVSGGETVTRANRGTKTMDQRRALVTSAGRSSGTNDPVLATCDYNVDSRPTASGSSDCIKGGDGHDVLHGQNGRDVMFGDAGEDFMSGGDGADLMRGGTQDDVMHGDDGDDEMYGDAGDDRMFGGNHNDYMRGNAGDDYMEGNAGDDEMYGDAGDDDLIGGSSTPGAGDGDDLVFGNAGDDAIIGDNGTITRPAAVNGVVPLTDVGALRRDVTLFDVNGADGTTFGADEIHGGPGADVVFGQAGDDTITGGEGMDWLEGNAGADVIHGDEHDDVILGGSSHVPTLKDTAGDTVAFHDAHDGDDELHGGEGDDLALGDNAGVRWDGAVWFWAGADSDPPAGPPSFAAATFGDDTLRGADGDDRLWGQLGDDELHGDAGHDYLAGDLATIARIPGDPAWPAPPSAFPGGAPRYQVDLVLPDDGGDDELHGGTGDDHGFGGAADDLITGGAGDDYLEGNGGADVVYGFLDPSDPGYADALMAFTLSPNPSDQDVILGGSSKVHPQATTSGARDTGDVLFGGLDHDVMLGDNGEVTREFTGSTWDIDPITTGYARTVVLYDRTRDDATDKKLSEVSGGDLMLGNAGNDRMFGQGGDDYLRGNDGDDAIEGNQGNDWIEGNDGDDDLIGGSACAGGATSCTGDADGDDYVWGGDGKDVIAGDNAVILRTAGGAAPYLTTVGRFVDFAPDRRIYLLDLGAPASPAQAGRYGDDRLSGGSGDDVVFGQDGDDWISGGPGSDYAEGDGGADALFGDRLLTDVGAVAKVVQRLDDLGISDLFDFPASLTGLDAKAGTFGLDVRLDDGVITDAGRTALEGDPGAPDGPDDLIGGSSIPGHRDGGDLMWGDGASDFMLGDNGELLRQIADGQYRLYDRRYPGHTAPSDAIIRDARRFDVGESTKESPAAVFGDDFMDGGVGDDTMYGQDGDDEMWGNAGDDHMYGELGDDAMYGGPGDDAMLGDRGSIRTVYLTGDPAADGYAPFTLSYTMPPFLTYDAFVKDRLYHQFDLVRDYQKSGAGAFVEFDRTPATHLAFNGLTHGGDDLMRGGQGHDAMHGAVGDDRMNGDSGGDILYGGDGADSLWGGMGDPADPANRGAHDRFVDYLFGGYGDDFLDYKPREGIDYTVDGSGNVVDDPLGWFEATMPYWHPDADATDDTQAEESWFQHHQGTDWMYGGWDRDVMQGDRSENGPNQGDRMMDWAGAYNLWTHCNAAYGGYNDVRSPHPTMDDFMERLAFATGAGELDDVRTAGTSAFRELAYVYRKDVKDNSGNAFPGTPGHFFEQGIDCTDDEPPTP